MNIINVALATPLRQHFDYLLPANINRENLRIGSRVLVPFGRQEKIGIIIGFTDESDFPIAKLKHILQSMDEQPIFDENVMALCRWASRYYHHPLGEVLHAAMPAQARKLETINFHNFDYVYPTPTTPLVKLTPRQRACLDFVIARPGLSTFDLKQSGFSASTLQALLTKAQLDCRHDAPPKQMDHITVIEEGPELNPAQANAVNALHLQPHFHCFLLNGVTGSGKTEVYLRAIEQQLSRGKQAIVLIPEIGLTPQTVQRFTERFAVPVVALHSRLSDSERLQAWIAAKTGIAKIIIGTRSAILTPAPDLGIIILDEEHDLSFKQQSRFRYSARDLAVMRAKLLNIPVLMGSATPSLESLYNVKQQRFT
ncbi:MAG: DEAD/DEAH box helicase, partial [Pseudomonadota bacterium]|nr:DEAD/DEAH box helicase [Pseudomonadota bacterium]